MFLENNNVVIFMIITLRLILYNSLPYNVIVINIIIIGKYNSSSV